MQNGIITVSELNTAIKKMFNDNNALQILYVKGEIANCKVHYSGHIYFTLKDESAVIRSVMFKGSAARLRFTPKDGMKVLASGRVDVFPRDGQYQLYCEHMVVDGVGELALAYEALKEKLFNEGLFDAKYKKEIPNMPQTIGVVTSKTGAVIKDIINIVRRRYPLAKIVLYPTLVQGDKAPKEIIAGIEFFNNNNSADVLIVGRGGGSMEDLWAFNDEGVARAIFASKIPIISAVGHETDVTISDYVADMRAPTPSAAAEICTTDILNVLQFVRERRGAIERSVFLTLKQVSERLEQLTTKKVFTDPLYHTKMLEEKNALLMGGIERSLLTVLEKNTTLLNIQMEKLNSLSPLGVLTRGYSIVLDKKGKNITDSKRLKPSDEITIIFANGEASCAVKSVRERKNG